MIRVNILGQWILPATIAAAVCGCRSVAGPAPLADIRPGAATVAGESATESPKAVAAQPLHDFGQMNPFTIGQHAFVIHNTGDGPLRLTLGSSSCSCTASSVPEDPVEPGHSAEVVVQWRTAGNKGRFRESISIKTNDPRQPTIDLAVVGDVLVHLGANPDELNFGEVVPDQPAVVSTIISSQVWDSFDIDGLHASLPDLQWELEPASVHDLARIGARSGWKLQLTLPDTLPVGFFSDWIGFRAWPTDRLEEAAEHQLPVTGKMLRRIGVHGPNIDHTGTIHLGAVHAGTRKEEKYVVKVRDPLRELAVIAQEVASPCLEVTFEPMQPAGKGLYQLCVGIAADADPCSFMRPHPASIVLQLDHPRIERLELQVEFAVLP